MKIGIKDIAKATGVSKSTVSNVLNGKANVGSATKDKILTACFEMGYQRKTRDLITKGENKTILFVFSDFDRSFYLKIIEGINDYASENGYDLMISTSKSCEKYMDTSITAGAIILDMRISSDTMLQAANQNYPLIVMDRLLDHPYIKCLVVNNYEPMAELMQGLVDRKLRRFAFLGGPEGTDDHIERYSAFLEVLKKNDIPFRKEDYFTGDWREQSGRRAAKIIMLSERRPEVLVCANDNMAIGAMRYFREVGCKVPDEICVTGFDNCELAAFMGITTVAIPNYERGYLAARNLIECIRGQGSFEPFKITAAPKWRKTVR